MLDFAIAATASRASHRDEARRELELTRISPRSRRCRRDSPRGARWSSAGRRTRPSSFARSTRSPTRSPDGSSRARERARRHSLPATAAHARLQALLDAQVYALVFWRRAAHEINYRRFFDINELVALRMEDPAVFGATHRRIIQWVKDGQLDGLRIDHVDGLRNPRDYLERLNAAIQQVLPGADIPIFVEKILSGRERLRAEWPVAGTTGYEFLAQLDAIFIDPDGRERDRAERTAPSSASAAPSSHFHEVAVRGKAFILRGSLSSDVQRLARLLAPIARRDARTAALTRAQLAEGIVQLIARLPVYRTYIEAGALTIHEDDRGALEQAFAEAADVALIRAPLLALLEEHLPRRTASLADERRAERDAFVLRFQQVSGPATAKGIEDTALYRYSPLLSLNEVGADPGGELRDAVGYLHDANIERSIALAADDARHEHARHEAQRRCARAHSTCSPRFRAEWARQLAHMGARASRLQEARARQARARCADGVRDLSDAGRHVAGARPDARRSRRAVRARDRRSRRRPRARRRRARRGPIPTRTYERALADFIRALFDRAEFRARARGVRGAHRAERRVERARAHGAASHRRPGFPDIYQGDELWNFSLVDPDNRRPVDYERDRSCSSDLHAMSPSR